MTSLSKELRALQFPDWQGEFEAAVREGDIGKRPERLRALRTAIFLRLKVNASRAPGPAERIALNDAIHLLRVLRNESSPFLYWHETQVNPTKADAYLEGSTGGSTPD